MLIVLYLRSICIPFISSNHSLVYSQIIFSLLFSNDNKSNFNEYKSKMKIKINFLAKKRFNIDFITK
jgi:hypothetical protein